MIGNDNNVWQWDMKNVSLKMKPLICLFSFLPLSGRWWSARWRFSLRALIILHYLKQSQRVVSPMSYVPATISIHITFISRNYWSNLIKFRNWQINSVRAWSWDWFDRPFTIKYTAWIYNKRKKLVYISSKQEHWYVNVVLAWIQHTNHTY